MTTQESLDGMRETAMRIPFIDELETGSRGKWSSPGGAGNDRTKKANELVRALVGQITKEGDIVVASDSKSKLWSDQRLKRTVQNWNNMSTLRGVQGSALRVFASSERLANQLKIKEIREVRDLVTKAETNAQKIGKLVKRVETGGPQARKIMKKVETGDRKVGELVKKIQMNDPKVG